MNLSTVILAQHLQTFIFITMRGALGLFKWWEIKCSESNRISDSQDKLETLTIKCSNLVMSHICLEEKKECCSEPLEDLNPILLLPTCMNLSYLLDHWAVMASSGLLIS